MKPLLSKAFGPRGGKPPSLSEFRGAAGKVAAPLDFVAIYDGFLLRYAQDPDQPLEGPPRGQGYFHPSSGLHPDMNHCMRAIYFDLMRAKRNPTSRPPFVLRVFDVGHGRHEKLARDWKAMADRRWMGMLSFKSEVHLKHPTLPISGSADGIITMANGATYLIDFKGIKSADYKKLVRPSRKYELQLMTYMGIAGVKNGYLLYENKDNQFWTSLRVDFDPQTYAEIEAWCYEALRAFLFDDFPAFDEEVCSNNYGPDGCSYSAVCGKCQAGANPMSFDRRTPEEQRKHLAVIQ